jgi:hypothetical protein
MFMSASPRIHGSAQQSALGNGGASSLLGLQADPSQLTAIRLLWNHCHYFMADTTFTWAIANLERETADGFVFAAHYTIAANDGTYSSSAYGSIGFQRPDDLIPYNQLEESTVIGWVKEALGGDEKIAEIEAALQAQIDEQRAPSKAAGVPW